LLFASSVLDAKGLFKILNVFDCWALKAASLRLKIGRIGVVRVSTSYFVLQFIRWQADAMLFAAIQKSNWQAWDPPTKNNGAMLQIFRAISL